EERWSGTTLDPLAPWYVGVADDGIRALEPSSSQWEFSSAVLTGEGVFGVTWINNNGDGELVAWATADYSTETGTFSDITVGKTSAASVGVPQVETAEK